MSRDPRRAGVPGSWKPAAKRAGRWGASAKMAAARGARLAAWGGRLRRGLAAGQRVLPGPRPLAAAVAGVALAGAGAAWYHGRVNVAAPEGCFSVLAQVRDRAFPPAPTRLLPPQAPSGRGPEPEARLSPRAEERAHRGRWGRLSVLEAGARHSACPGGVRGRRE